MFNDPMPRGRSGSLVVWLLVSVAVVPALVVLPAATVSAAPADRNPLPNQEGRSALGATLVERALPSGASLDFLAPPPANGARTDTIDFGFYEIRGDGLKYAVTGGLWTWDHGAPDPLEGWTSVDLSANDRDYWRWMTASIWAAEGNPGPWPQMNGSAGIALCGASEPVADTLLWVNGIGYGNEWCQRLVSPALTYDGSGDVLLSFHYFNQTEANYDYTKLIVQTSTRETLLNSPGFNGSIGIDTAGVIQQVTYTRAITNTDLGGGATPRPFTVRVEFRSDGGLSDQDGASGWDALYGAVGVDDVALDGANLTPPVARQYDFEDGLQGWTAERCPGAGTLMGVAALGSYAILDPCGCRLSGNVLEMHDDTGHHPGDLDPIQQHEQLFSAIVDRRSDIGDPTYLDYNRIMAEWDQYSEMPMENGVFYRPGWSYYPFENPNLPGLVQWSQRVGVSTYFYVGNDPSCVHYRNIGTDWGLPPASERVKFIYEIFSTCDFDMWGDCPEATNFTPILDNVRVRNTHVAAAPVLAFEPGGMFQDGFGQDQIGPLNTSDPGWANTAYNVRVGNESAIARMGDSLVVRGPIPNLSSRWEAKLWLRVKRAGPGQNSNSTYVTWKNAWIAARGIPFTPPQSLFTWGYMDSVEVVNPVSKNKFCSQFRDGPSYGGGDLPADLMYSWGPDTGEQDEGNEMIPDLALTPGTKIDYFITANYTCTPTEYFYLPDTSGGNFAEFEILPSMRLAGGVTKFPCLLYVDADNRGTQFVVENALNVVLTGAAPGAPLPDPAPWDRYDYLDATSNWKASYYRQYGGTAGATIPQLIGYRAILIDTGSEGPGCTLWRDWVGIQNWLTAPLGDGNVTTQAFIAGGSSVSAIIDELYPQFLHETLAATHSCGRYSDAGCPSGETENDRNACVRLNPIAGSVFGSDTIPTDLFGNWCPGTTAYGVLGVNVPGVGNKNYVKVGSGAVTHYAQVVTDRNSNAFKYRTCLQDFSYSQVTARDADFPNDPDLECPTDSASRVTAAVYEIRNALKWTLNVANLLNLGICGIPTGGGTDTDPASGTGLTDRLYPNHPNPFNPRTTVRFSLSAAGAAKLVVFDVTGRRVRTLVDGTQSAGLHEVIWDGTDDAGRPLPSGVYWTRLSTGSFQSNRKMVILK